MEDWNEIRKWRSARREELIARRASLSRAEHERCRQRITDFLQRGFAASPGMVIGFCWPYRGEIDARFAVRHWRDQGAIAALPEVLAKRTPLRFRKWWPGAPMASRVYDIPVPVGTDVVVPDAVVVPMVAFDDAGYRLGYGGGYFDCTLAALAPRPVSIGLCLSVARLATIFPQSHDIPMDFVVTEEALHAGGGPSLKEVDAGEFRERAAQLLARRGLPRSHDSGANRNYSSPACYAHEFPGYWGEPPDRER